MRRPAPPRLAVVLATEVRAFTWAELVAASSKDGVARAVASGSLVRIAPGVYAATEHAASFHVRAHAALLWAGGEAVLSGAAAMCAWGLTERPPDVIEVTVPGGSHRRPPPGFTMRTCAEPVARTVLRGLAVLGPAHAVVSGFGRLPASERGDVVFRAIRSRRVSAAQLRLALTATAKVIARRELERRIDAAERGAMSPLEEHGLRAVFNGTEFSRFVRQHEVVLEGSVYYMDMFDPVTRTVVELDGARWHSDADARERDIRRDAHLATIGILTLRFSTRQLMSDPNWCRFVVRQVLRAREKGLRARSSAA